MGTDEALFIKVAGSGDASGFALLTERYRRELQVHCYRMLASYDDAQDMTQETFLRAWHRRATFEGRSSLRTWLYRIATNVCLDFLEHRRQRVPVPAGAPGAGSEVTYLQPFPDHALDAASNDPEERAVARETIELAFIVAVQHLPPRQRAVLILRDILGWPGPQAAEALELTPASANSALQRARETMRSHLPDGRLDWSARTRRELSDDERALVDAYVRAHEALDIEALTDLLREDIRFAMPPEPGVLIGRDACIQGWIEGGFGSPELADWACLPATANGQPAVAAYLRRPGDTAYRAFAVDVLRVTERQVAEITTFPGEVFAWLGLPPTLERKTTS